MIQTDPRWSLTTAFAVNLLNLTERRNGKEWVPYGEAVSLLHELEKGYEGMNVDQILAQRGISGRPMPLPDDIRECCGWLRHEFLPYEVLDTFPHAFVDDDRATEAAVVQILEYLGVL